MTDIDAAIRAAKLTLRDADDAIQNGKDCSAHTDAINALITTVGAMIAVIGDQQRQIERLQDALQNHLETTPRQRR